MCGRRRLRHNYLETTGWRNADAAPLIPDASFRKYFRLTRADKTAILMDAPPGREDIGGFIKVTKHLQSLNIRTPCIYHADSEQGFAILEDVGDDTFTRLLERGESEQSLYEKAVDVLLSLHLNDGGIEIDAGNYNLSVFLQEAGLFCDWYLPALTMKKSANRQKTNYLDCWKMAFASLPPLPEVCVLRDYHVDNLIKFQGECVVLDYQDALIGSPAYDLASLLEDARRDVNSELKPKLLKRYQDGIGNLDAERFQHHFDVWGAQRHCKVAGIFTRLWLRDNKPVYLIHLNRVMGLLSQKLGSPALQSVRDWFQKNQIDLVHHGFNHGRDEILEVTECAR